MAKYPAFDGTQLCAQVDPELFFPERGEIDKSASAVRICGGCHFKQACLEYAINFHITGIWGGTTEQQRRKIAIQKGIRREMVSSFEPDPAGHRILSTGDWEEDKRREQARIAAKRRYEAKKQERLANQGAA